MELVIAEKPSVARDLARVLGVRTGGKHSFDGDRYTITWCIGHLVELEEPAAYDPAWKAWRLDRLPMLPQEFRLRGSKHALPQLRAVEKLLRDRAFSAVINACDAGREGELIFRYVYQHARSRLAIRRLWVSSLTDEAIRRGFAQLQPGRSYEALADAARSRSEADWLVGMNATRALTARGREAGHDALYSIGRVQTPTLAMMVARETEIAAFVPRDYWEVAAALTTADGAAFPAQWRHDKAARLASAQLAGDLVARDTASSEIVVERVRAKTVKEPPPQLFDLTTLQRTANRRYGFSAQRTLELAQALYERHKLITYPRTDSRHLSSDVAKELVPAFEALAQVPAYAPFARQLIAHPPAPNRRIVDDSKVSDHHAIIPTGSRIPQGGSLDRDEARLLDLIARRFLGVFFPDAEFANTEAWIKVGAGAATVPATTAVDKEKILDALPAMPDLYLARGRVRLVAGWQDVAGFTPSASPGRERDDEHDHDKEPSGALPPLVEGQRLAGRFSPVAKQTTPPPRYTEATLLGAMESAGKQIDDEALRAAMRDTGLGTPATRASIIETLLRRDFIARDGKWLVPTPTGMGLISAIPVPSLASPELTGGWEARLASIARGADSRDAFMADIRRYVTEVVDAIRGGTLPPAPQASTSAPRRAESGPGRSRKRSGQSSKWKQRVRDAKRARPRPASGAMTSSSSTKRRAAPVAPKVVVGASPTESPLACPRCGEGTLITGQRGWGCSRYRLGCTFVIWFESAGRRLTETQLRDLVTKGNTRKASFGPGEGRLVLERDAPGGVRFDPDR